MTLALEKVFVITGGIGVGLIIFGATWRVRNPSPDDGWNRRLYEKGPRDMRLGAILALVSLVALGALRLV
jgi:hypothetical protein